MTADNNPEQLDNNSEVEPVSEDSGRRVRYPVNPVPSGSSHRQFIANIEDEDEDDGEGDVELKPESDAEFEQRLARREAEAQYGEHVRSAHDPDDRPDPDAEQGMGQSLLAHPLLAGLPEGTQAPIERPDANENDAARMELKRKLENKLRERYTSTPNPNPF